jgi:hypothetical protein
MDFFSPVQGLGYLAFVLGVSAFLQKEDWKLKSLGACESMAYVAHFIMLGNPAAVVSCALASIRSILAVKIRSARLAVFFIAANIALGLYVMDSPLAFLPIAGSCAATWAALVMSGIRMRIVFLFATALWLVNNILSGSIGGTVLEVFILTANGTTILRMTLDSRRAAAA